MKKVLVRVIAVVMAMLFAFPMTAYADEGKDFTGDTGDAIGWEDIELTDEEIEEILANNPQAQPRATGLICAYNLGIAKNGSSLSLVAKTYGSPDVIKAGFTEVVVQRRSSSSDSWVTYIKYVDIYTDGPSYLLSKALTVPTSYQYRATCVHYAKKNILSVEKISNTSNIVTM